MFNVELLSDRVAGRCLDGRLNTETQRRQRIFNDTVRTIGIDTDALDIQVREKKTKEETEQQSLNAHAADMVRSDRVALLLDGRQVKAQRAMEEAVVGYRQHFQQPQGRREYDMNDPELWKREEARMMLPGLVGEDPGSQARLRRQKEQLGAWLHQQQCERLAARDQQRLEDQQYDWSRVHLDNKALQLQKLEEEKKKAAVLATKDYNRAQAAERQERRRREQQWNADVCRADVLNQLQGEQLVEDIQQPTLGVLGAPRTQPSQPKRAPPQSLLHTVQFQKYQTEERKRMEMEKQELEAQQDRFRVSSARSALLLERQQARLDKQRRRELDHINATLAQTQKLQNKALNEMNINRYEESFFSKFNTSSR